MAIKKLVADIATLFVKEDAELSCEYREKLPVFDIRADGDKNILVSDDGVFAIPLSGPSAGQFAQDIVSYALSVDADAYVSGRVNEGKKHRGGLLAFYNEAVEHSAMALGIGAALTMVGELSLLQLKSAPANYAFDLGNWFLDNDVMKPNRFFFDEKLGVVQIILPFPFRFRRDMRHDFWLDIQKKEPQDSAAIAIGRYLVGDSRDERILKQLMSENESTAMPVLLAAKTWVRAYLGALVIAIGVVEQFRNTAKCG